MQNEESGGTFVRYRYFHFHRSRASSFRQVTMFSAICIYIYTHHLQLHDCKLIPQNKEDYKSPDVQKGTVADTALYNSIPFTEQCYHIIQYLHSPEIDRHYPDLMTNMQGRILKEKLIDTNGMRQGRSCSIQMLINL